MRKKPQQQRSKQMVASLVDATGACIMEFGLDGTTTPRIAEKAGVSVGSLYQYFDDKESLIEALVEKLAQDISNALTHLPWSQNQSIDDIVRVTIQFGFALLNSSDGLYLELVRNWHRLPTDIVMNTLQQKFMDIARVYFLKNYHKHQIDDLHVRIFIIANSVMFTMVRLVGQPDSLLTQEEVEQGLVKMVVGYLTEPSAQDS